jgi:hypothetical protein
MRYLGPRLAGGMTKRPKQAWKKALLRLADLWLPPYLGWGDPRRPHHIPLYTLSRKKLCKEANHPVVTPAAVASIPFAWEPLSNCLTIAPPV